MASLLNPELEEKYAEILKEVSGNKKARWKEQIMVVADESHGKIDHKIIAKLLSKYGLRIVLQAIEEIPEWAFKFDNINGLVFNKAKRIASSIVSANNKKVVSLQEKAKEQREALSNPLLALCRLLYEDRISKDEFVRAANDLGKAEQVIRKIYG